MSRKSNCYDNAPIEYFWGTMKSELGHHRRCRTREEAIREITEYIEVFYNREPSETAWLFIPGRLREEVPHRESCGMRNIDVHC